MTKMPYITACLKESLRMTPPVPWIGRHSTEEIALPDGRHVPKGTNIVVGKKCNCINK